MSFGSTVLVVVWLAVGVVGLLGGLVWLRSVESRSDTAAGGQVTDSQAGLEPLRNAPAAARPARLVTPLRRVVADGPEPDSLAG